MLIEEKEEFKGGGEMGDKVAVVGVELHGLGVEDAAALFQFRVEVDGLGGGNADWGCEKEGWG